MSASLVVLILGAGASIGASVAKRFAGDGYQVALVSRNGSGTKTPEGFLSLAADFTDPDSIPDLFETIKTEFHTAPSVVIYNAVAFTPPAGDSIFSVSATSLGLNLNVNTISPYAAAQQAVIGWNTLPKTTIKTFIYTGNIQNVAIMPMPLTTTLGVGKAASAYWLGMADTQFSAKGFRFFYADERNVDGTIKGMALDGDAHAEFYAQLVSHEANVPWHATFVKGKGYTQFK